MVFERRDGKKEKENGAFNRYFNTRNREGCSWGCSHLDPRAAAGLMQTPVNSLNLTKLGIICLWFRAPGAPGSSVVWIRTILGYPQEKERLG